MDTFLAIKREYNKKFYFHTELQQLSRLIFPTMGKMVSYLPKVILPQSRYYISELRRNQWLLAEWQCFKHLLNLMMFSCGEGNSAK